MTEKCPECGANTIGDCQVCGAPQCCPQCCRIAELKAERDKLTARLGSHPDAEKLIVQLRELVEQRTSDMHEFASRTKRLQAIVDKVRKVLLQVERISCGEDQVADDDSEGMGVIYRLVAATREAAEAAKEKADAE